MTDELIKGVCGALREEFGNDICIYTEKQEQQFERPSFFVRIAKSDTELFRGNRYYMQNEVLVTYYPPYYGKNENMADIAQRLSICLEIITADGAPLRAADFTDEIAADFITATVHYSFFVVFRQTEDDSELMAEHTVKFSDKE